MLKCAFTAVIFFSIVVKSAAESEEDVTEKADPKSIVEILYDYFDVMDTDEDGTLSMKEAIVGAAKFGISKKITEPFFVTFDTDADGYVTKIEFDDVILHITDALKDVQIYFEDIDVNNNTKISLEEALSAMSKLPGMPLLPRPEVEKLFFQIDTDDDKQISWDEIEIVLEKLAAAAPQEEGYEAWKLLPFFDEIDANKDGELSYNEVFERGPEYGVKERGVNRFFATYDADANDQITKEEFAGALLDHEEVLLSELLDDFDNFDTDNSGGINVCEALSVKPKLPLVQFAKLFEMTDANRDKSLSEEELDIALENLEKVTNQVEE